MCATDDFKFKIINNRLDTIEKDNAILANVRSGYSIVVKLDILIESWEKGLAIVIRDAGVEKVEDVVSPAHAYTCNAIKGCLKDVKELRKYALDKL